MHVDVNSAYLAFSAVNNLQHGAVIDLREIVSVVGGSEETRHGIVLAKSMKAKKYGIRTGESLMEARGKAPDLYIEPPKYDVYVKASKALMDLLYTFTPIVQQFSIDEAFIDYTGCKIYNGSIYATGRFIADEVYRKLGFTVNVGISTNKVLAKMAGELKKPNKVHTLFSDEIQDKLWGLDVGELYMCGYKTKTKLNRIGINTIGDLARTDKKIMGSYLNKHGEMLWDYANGIYFGDSEKGGAGNFQASFYRLVLGS